jgi:hypothetical protein
MADLSSNLEIVISAVDEASAALEDVGRSMDDMATTAAAVSSSMDESLASVGLAMNETTGEIENAALTQEQSFNQLAEVLQTDSAEIQDLILSEGISFQEASAVVEEANAAIASSTDQATSVSRSNFIQLGIVAGAVFAAVSGATNSAVAASVAWNEQSAVLAETLKDTGSSVPLAEVQAYAEQLQATTLFTQQSALQAAELVMSHKNLQSSFQSVISVASDMATKMHTDLPSATRVLTNALADPVAGVNQLIRTFNTDFTAAQVTAIQNMAKVGDTAGADALILKALNESIGGTAKAAADASGAGMTKLNNDMTSMSIVIGQDLNPLLDALAKALDPVIKFISKWADEHPKLTAAIIVGVVILTALIALIAAIGILALTVIPGIAALTAVVTGFGAALSFVAANPVVLIIAAIALIILAIYELITHWKEVSAFLQAELKVLADNWHLMWQNMSDFLAGIWASIKNTIKSGINDVIGLINSMINALNSIHISIPAIQVPGTKIGTPAIDLGFNIPDIPMLASGGIVYNPVLAMIGEQGPEAVVPLSSLGGAGGFGGGTQIIVNIQGGIFPADQSAIKQIGDLLAKTITAQLRTRNYAN